MSSDARTTILDRIQSALSDRTEGSSASPPHLWEAIPRTYGRSRALEQHTLLELLEDRLRDYDAEVTRAQPGEVAAVLDAILCARGGGPTLIPLGFPEEWRPAFASLVVDDDLSTRQLDAYDCVLTGATIAIADTGTLVLQSRPGQGRRAATLIPDVHLCVVRTEDVVASVPEAFARLQSTRAYPTTFVSGPSATADIEMTRIKGVHGPRFLRVVLVL